MKKILLIIVLLMFASVSSYGYDYGIDDAVIVPGLNGSVYAGIWMNDSSDMNIAGIQGGLGISPAILVFSGIDIYQFEDGDWEMDQFTLGSKISIIPETLAVKLSYNMTEDDASDYYKITLAGMTTMENAVFMANAGYGSSDASNIFPVGVKAKLPISYTSYLIAQGEMILTYDSDDSENYMRHFEVSGGLGYEIHEYIDLEITGSYIGQTIFIGGNKEYDDDFVKFQAYIKYSPAD